MGSRVLFKNITTDTVLAYCIKQSSVPEGKRYSAAQRGNYLVLHFADQKEKWEQNRANYPVVCTQLNHK